MIMDVNKLSMKLLSYNCRGFNAYKSQYISQLLSVCECDRAYTVPTGTLAV